MEHMDMKTIFLAGAIVMLLVGSAVAEPNDSQTAACFANSRTGFSVIRGQ